MKALVYQGSETLEFGDVPNPVPQGSEVLIKIENVGICGSDMHAYLGHDERRPAPLILGHEAAGVIASGENEGRRVTINPLVTCQHCEYCNTGRDNLCQTRQIISMPPREGAFAEFISMPERNLIFVPDDVSSEKAALAEPIACGWNAARKAKEHVGEHFAEAFALVMGGGAIGVGAALSLKAHGVEAVTVVEPHDERRDFLNEKIGLEAVSPDQLADNAYFDLVIDGVGFEATRAQASMLVRPGGVICHIGLGSAEGGLDIRRMTLQEVSFIGCYTYTQEDFRETAEAIFDGRLGALDWMEIRPLADGAQAFADLRSGAVMHPKIILKP